MLEIRGVIKSSERLLSVPALAVVVALVVPALIPSTFGAALLGLYLLGLYLGVRFRLGIVGLGLGAG